MSSEKLYNYKEKLVDDEHIIPFLSDINSIKLLQDSFFGEKCHTWKYKKTYSLFLDLILYLKKNNFTDIIFVSGITFLLYGLRTINDIDLVMKKYYNIKYNKIKIDKSVLKKNTIDEKLFENKNYTFYFKGFRVNTPQADIYLSKRSRVSSKKLSHPKALADIIMVKHLINSTIELPFNINKLSKTNKDRVLKKLKYEYRTKYNPFTEKI